MKAIELNKIDPATGLRLISNPPPQETEEQARKRLFWQFMFRQQLAWLAGDSLAIAKSVTACSDLGEPPPDWLLNAVLSFVDRRMTDAERRRSRELVNHQLRWEAVLLVRGTGTSKLAWDKCWETAADMLAGSNAEGSAETVRASYKLIQAAGGESCTLETYLRVVQGRISATD